MRRYRATSRLRLTHHVAVALVLLLALPALTWARPTHGPIEPIAAAVELDSSTYFPLDVGRTWTFHDSLGIRRRHVIAGSATIVAKNGTVLDQLRRREIYEVPEHGEPKLRVDADQVVALVPRGCFLCEDVPSDEHPHDEELGTSRDNRKPKPLAFTDHTDPTTHLRRSR